MVSKNNDYKPSGKPFEPVRRDAIEKNRADYAAMLAAKALLDKHVAPVYVKKTPVTYTPMELRKFILCQKDARPYVVPLTKTWEATKPCADQEDTTWRDPTYKQVATSMCRNTCTVVLQCLEKDRLLGGEEGIRAGKTQSERQAMYALQAKDETKPILSDFADATYVARVLMKQSIHG